MYDEHEHKAFPILTVVLGLLLALMAIGLVYVSEELADVRATVRSADASDEKTLEADKEEEERKEGHRQTNVVASDFVITVADVVQDYDVPPITPSRSPLLNDVIAWETANKEACMQFKNLDGSAAYDPDFVRALGDFVGVLDTDNAREDFEETVQRTLVDDDTIDRACRTPDGTPLLLVTAHRDMILILYTFSEWPEGRMHMNPIMVRGLEIWGGFGFVNNWKGKMLLVEGYGDAGYVWWSYYEVDPLTYDLTLIEQCNGQPVVIDSAEYDLQCDPQYVW